MTYDLALRLKNAGFPQEPKGELYLYEDVLTNYCPHGIGVPLLCSHDEKAWKKKKQKPIPVKNPTLSELIEVCGYEFGGLALGGKRGETRFGDAVFEGYRAWGKNIETPLVGYETPKEAVANLWLALNKK